MWLKRWFIMRGRKPVPWAYFLTDVAAKDPVLHLPVKHIRYSPLFFDGCIRDALAPVQKIPLLVNSIRGTGIDTSPAGAAIILDWLIVSQFDVDEYLPQKKVRTGFGMN